MTTEAQTPEQEQEAPAPGSPEYNEMMAAKFREAKADAGGQYPETPEDTNEADPEGGEEKPKAPEGIPEKFIREDGTVDVEALAKSYTELERQRSQKPEDSQEDTSKSETTEDDEKAAQAASEAGLDMDTLREKVQTQGKLDDSDYEALEKAGVPRDIVDEYIALRQDLAERTQAEVLEYVGGEDSANDLMSWAAQNLSAAEIDAYNTMLASAQWKAAIDTLQTLRGQTKPSASEPNLRSASGSPSGTPTGYTSRDEMRADMANPLYHEQSPKGEAFRADVQRKMAYAAWRRK